MSETRVLLLYILRVTLHSLRTYTCCGGKVPLSFSVVGAEEKFLTENISLNSGTLYNCRQTYVHHYITIYGL